MQPVQTRGMYRTHTFHANSTLAQDGTAFEVGSMRTLTVEIVSSSLVSARTVAFKAVRDSGTMQPLVGINISSASLTPAVTTTGTNELWQFDVTGLEQVYMDITAFTGSTGNTGVTIKGKAVSQ